MNALPDMVRRADPDRFFCALFAPVALRADLFTLYTFNHELARATEVASEPGLALIRLHWWREVVEGAERRHPVATPLRALLAEGAVRQDLLLSMIDTREADLDAPETVQAWLDRLRAGPGALAMAAALLLGADAAASMRVRDLGAAYGAAGTLGNVPALAARQRCALPLDALGEAGLVPEAVFQNPVASLCAVRPALAARGLALAGPAAPLPRAVLAAGLPGVLARRDLRRSAPPGPRGVGDRLAVLWAAALGRL